MVCRVTFDEAVDEAVMAASSTRGGRIEHLPGPAGGPLLIRLLGERKRPSRCSEDFRQCSYRIRKIRAPRNPGGAERLDDLSEERIWRALAPALGRHVVRGHLQIELSVFRERKEIR